MQGKKVYEKETPSLCGSTSSLEDYFGSEKRGLFRTQPDGCSEHSETPGQNTTQLSKTGAQKEVTTSYESLQNCYPSLAAGLELASNIKSDDKNHIERDNINENQRKKVSSPSLKNIFQKPSLLATLSSKSLQENSRKFRKCKLFERFRRSPDVEKQEVKKEQ